MIKVLRNDLIDKIKNRYQDSTKEGKKIILDEFCTNHNYNRKYVIRVLNEDETGRILKTLGRKRKYHGVELLNVLREVWRRTNRICSKKLAPALKIWVPRYKEYFKVEISEATIELLFSISPATIDRLLGVYRRKIKRHKFCCTKPGLILKSRIPIKKNQWNEAMPGFLEADTVSHCGSSNEGTYVITVDFVDINTQWSIQRAIMGKGSTGVLNSLKNVIKTLPFKIRGFDSDNGSEFINYPIIRFFEKRKKYIQFTRSREYCKNDNAHVEEKNYSIVREYIGYERYDTDEALQILNDLYSNELYLLINFFIPNFKLINKIKSHSKIIRIHDKPKTPYQRILNSEFISKNKKKLLTKQFNSLNPFLLQENVNKKISALRKLAKS
jgi:lambda repressor-like predicted transcriptional regulator